MRSKDNLTYKLEGIIKAPHEIWALLQVCTPFLPFYNANRSLVLFANDTAGISQVDP